MLKSERKASWMQARILHASRQLHFACGCPGAEHRAKLAVDLTVSMKNRPHDVPRNHVIGRFVRVTPPQAGFFLHGTLAPVSKTRLHKPLTCFGSERDPFRSVPVSNSQHIHVPGLAVVENLAVAGDQGVAADARGGDQQASRRTASSSPVSDAILMRPASP